MSKNEYDLFLARREANAIRGIVTGNAPVNEAKLHEEIFDECQRRGWIALHGSMSRATHRTAGEPDFVILADNGRVFLVECKSKTGKLSLDQAAMKAHANKLGHTIHVVRSIEEFLAIIK